MVSRLIGVLSRLTVCINRLKLGSRELEFFPQKQQIFAQNPTNGRLGVDRSLLPVDWRSTGNTPRVGFSRSVDCPVDRHTAESWVLHVGRLSGRPTHSRNSASPYRSTGSRPTTPLCTLCTSVDRPVDRSSEICCCWSKKQIFVWLILIV